MNCVEPIKIKSKARFSGMEYYDFPWYIQDILLGSALGDGHFVCRTVNSNCSVKLSHSLTQEDYLRWKANILQSYFGGSVYQSTRDEVLRMIRYDTRVHKELTAFYFDLYKKKDGEVGGKLHPRLKWLNRMTALGLMVWYFDDGHLRHDRRISIHTEGLTHRGVLKCQQHLEQAWNLNPRLERRSVKEGREDQYAIIIKASESQRFLEIILPLIPKECKSMLYKIAMVYKNTKFQQRWISKLIELSPFTEEEIAEYYRTKLSGDEFAKVFDSISA